MRQTLSALGFSENETTIYLFLLKNGSTTTGRIIRETSIANSRVYESLHALVRRGFVTYTVHKDGKHFAAVDPAIFKEKERERFALVNALVPQLQQAKGATTEAPLTAVYEGFDGFRTAFKKTIDDCPVNGTLRILGFSSQAYANQSLRTYITNMNLKSAEKKQKLLILLDSSTRKTLGKDREKEKYSAVRYLPKGYMSPAAIDIFGDYVYIFTWGEQPFVYMIKNRQVAESFTQYFDTLWKIAKK